LRHEHRAGAAYHWRHVLPLDGEVLFANILGKAPAARDAIGKVHGTQLKVSVTAAPEAIAAAEVEL